MMTAGGGVFSARAIAPQHVSVYVHTCLAHAWQTINGKEWTWQNYFGMGAERAHCGAIKLLLKG